MSSNFDVDIDDLYAFSLANDQANIVTSRPVIVKEWDRVRVFRLEVVIFDGRVHSVIDLYGGLQLIIADQVSFSEASSGCEIECQALEIHGAVKRMLSRTPIEGEYSKRWLRESLTLLLEE